MIGSNIAKDLFLFDRDNLSYSLSSTLPLFLFHQRFNLEFYSNDFY